MSAVYDSAYRSRPDLFGTDPNTMLAQLIEDEQVTRRALDLGCGDGRNSIFLSRNGFDVHALDTSTAGIARLDTLARSHGLPITAQVADIRDLSEDMGRFDLIVADTVLCHLDWEDAVKVAGRIERILNPDGWLYAIAFSPDDPQESEFAGLNRTYFAKDAFCGLFPGLSMSRCDEKRVTDTSHGPVHEHALVRLVAKREG